MPPRNAPYSRGGQVLRGLARLGQIPTGDTRETGRTLKRPYVGSREKERYLAQRRMRGLGDWILGGADVLNDYINAGLRDIKYLTGGIGADAYQFTQPSQDLANLAAATTGANIVPEERMSPQVRAEGKKQRALVGMIPTGPEDFASAAKIAVLHNVPNLFKKAAIEDLKAGKSPDEIWHDWQWEQNAQGDWWTETTGKPELRTDVTHTVSQAKPPRRTEFEPQPMAEDQLELFTEKEAPAVGGLLRASKTGDYDMPPALYSGMYDFPAGKVSDFVANQQLYEQPGLEFLGGLPMGLHHGPLTPADDASGFFHWPTSSRPQGAISVRSGLGDLRRANPNPVATTQHELTHAAAEEFGLPQGYNPSNVGAAEQGAKIRGLIETDMDAVKAAIDQRNADWKKWEDEDFAKWGDLSYKRGDFDEETGRVIRPGYMSITDFKLQWNKDHPELARLIEDNQEALDLLAKSDPQLAYWSSMGEVSARNAGKRDTGVYSPDLLRKFRPERTEDVPRRYQWTENVTGSVKQRGGSNSEIPIASKLDPTNPEPGRGLGVQSSLRSSPGTEVPSSSVVDPTINPPKGIGAAMAKTTARAARVKGLAAPAIIRAKPKVTAKHPISSIVPTVPVKEMVAKYEPSGKMLPEKKISFEDLEEGSTLIPVRGDPTIAGSRLMGLGGKLFEKAVELPGGPGFMRGPQQVAQGIGWASMPPPSSALSKRAAEIFRKTGKPVYGGYMKMSQHSGDYAAHMAKVVKQMWTLNRSKIPNAMVRQFDEAMRNNWGKPNKKTGKYDYPATKDWPGMDNLTDEWILTHPNDRKKMVKMMNQKGWQDAGFPDIGYARWATTEPELLETPSHTSGFGIVKFDPEGRVTQTPEIPHESYSQQNFATYEGRTEDVPLDVLYEGYSKGISPSHLEKFLQTRPPLVTLNAQTVDRVLNYIRSSEGVKLGLAGAIAAGVITESQAQEIRDAYNG